MHTPCRSLGPSTCPWSALGLALAGLWLTSAQAVTPKPEEFAVRQQWVERVFGLQPTRDDRPYLKVVYEDVADSVTRGRSWRGTPYQLGQKTYTHGLAFNSTKHIQVHLGQPATRFQADVGLENNDNTRQGALQGRGSVTFHVLAGGQETFKSPVLRLRDGPLPIDVPLAGAQEFEIRVGDGGDGRGWDQALWAEATVHLSDGSALRLQDLPWAEEVSYNPFVVSFTYDGRPSSGLLKDWKRAARETPEAAKGRERDIVYRDPVTGLEVRLVATVFQAFPAVEWVAHLRNTGESRTPLLESIQSLDTAMPMPAERSPTLHWAKGGVASFDDFAPQATVLQPGKPLHLQPGGGRSSSQVLPFFNLAGARGGVVAAIGWSGEWAADFACTAQGTVTFKSGQAKTRLRLEPGEEIRTPSMLLLFYEGDRWRGQNLLRQFLLAHHRPLLEGRPLVAPITCGNWGGTRAEIHLDNIRKIIQHRLPLDYYWIDAEWYGRTNGDGSWPVNVGNWEVKRTLYPRGFKPLSDALRASGRHLMLWFEPERVVKGTPWFDDHREWLLDTGGGSLLYNLGNPQARQFLTDFISSKIDEFGLGCYRQDFNIDPLPFWEKADAPDRVGVSEIRHLEGLYAFWDGLRARHPDLLIDNCASGGRRLDLETAGRATPFWRTDGPRDPIAHQCHTYGLLAWWPLSSTSQDRASDDYEFRSSMCSALCLNWWVSGDAPAERIPEDFPFEWARRTLDQYVGIRSFYYGDYYPLTEYSQARDVWMAYQLDRPDQGQGLVVALRRPASPYQTARLMLHELDESANYKVRALDTKTERTYPGRELIREGVEVSVGSSPGSALLVYERQAP